MTRPQSPLSPNSQDAGRSAWAGRQPDDGSFDVAGIAGWMARRYMQTNPEIEPNFQSTVRKIVGPRFSDGEVRVLQDRALDAIEVEDLDVLRNIQEGVPVKLGRPQKARVDRLMGLMGSDALGVRARAAYGEALKNGQIQVR